jgi:transposase
MRGLDARQTQLFTFLQVEDRVPQSHPLRQVRSVAINVQAEIQGRLDRLYARSGRVSIPPEQLLRALLLWALYGVPSERRLLEEMEYNLLFRWFVGQGLEDEIWPRTTFSENRQRLVLSGAAGEFFARVLSGLPSRLLFNDHFSLNRSLVEEWSGQRSLDIDGRED